MQQAFEYLRENRDKFPDRLPEILLNEYFVSPTSRTEFIFVGPRASGKTTWLRQNGWLRDDGSIVGNGVYGYDADQDAADLATMGKKLTVMKRFRENEWRSHPDYVPIVVMSDTNWTRLKSRTTHSIDATHVANIKFPQAAFYAALKKVPVNIEAVYEVFGATFLLAATDAHGRLLPGLAYSMLLATLDEGGRVTRAKARAQAKVAGEWLAQQQDLARWLIELVPSYKRLVDKQQTVNYHLKTVRSRLLSHSFRTRTERPFGLGVNEYMKYLEAAGVWRVTDKGYAHWGRPYSIGSAYHKLSLTTKAIDAILPA